MSPRKKLFLCAFIDLITFLGLSLFLDSIYHGGVSNVGVLICAALCYLLCNWLMGTYTVLRWPHLKIRRVLQRLALAATSTILLLVMGGWILRSSVILFGIFNSNILISIIAIQSLIALFTRVLFRIVDHYNTEPSWQLIAAPTYQKDALREWQRNPFAPNYSFLNSGSIEPINNYQNFQQLRFAFSPKYSSEPEIIDLVRQLRDRGAIVTTVEKLAERHLERFPPRLLPDQWLSYDQIPWSNEFSFQRKLKRTADVLISGFLLLSLSPVFLILIFLIWLEDRGPAFYIQERSGWMGKPFFVYKLRTMKHSSSLNFSAWTVPNDLRITKTGNLLRKLRLDELPQLWNVFIGEMSLIGPRPEQPHLEENLSKMIPHFRKRHWMLPGISGWAQVCGPAYASSIEDTELKLSYDLFYLRNFNTSLDFLIFVKTLKIILHANGR